MSRTSKIDAVLADLLADLGSDASRRAYASDWKFFTAWLGRRKVTVLGATPKDVKAYVVHLADRGQAQRSRGRALSVIRAVYGAAVEAMLLKYNPAREVKNTKRGKSAKPVTWLEEEALAAILAFGARGDTSCLAYRSREDQQPSDLAWMIYRDRMCIQLLAGTGRRRSEVARVRVEDFTSEGISGVVKGGAVKTAPVPDWLREELKDWLMFAGITSGPVLPRAPDRPDVPINGDIVYLIVKRVAKAVGIEQHIAPHGLRRSLATLSERHGVPLADIQAQLNHASQSTTEHYLKGSRRVTEAPAEWMGSLARPKNQEDEDV